MFDGSLFSIFFVAVWRLIKALEWRTYIILMMDYGKWNQFNDYANSCSYYFNMIDFSNLMNDL